MLHICGRTGTERRFTFRDMKRRLQPVRPTTSPPSASGAATASCWFSSGTTSSGSRSSACTSSARSPSRRRTSCVEHDFSYRFDAAGVSAIVCTADGDTAHQVELADRISPTLEHARSWSAAARDGWHDFDAESELFSRHFQPRGRTRPAATIRCSCSSPPAPPVIRRSRRTATNTRWATIITAQILALRRTRTACT